MMSDVKRLVEKYCQANNLDISKLDGLKIQKVNDTFLFCKLPESDGNGLVNERKELPQIIFNVQGDVVLETEQTRDFFY